MKQFARNRCRFCERGPTFTRSSMRPRRRSVWHHPHKPTTGRFQRVSGMATPFVLTRTMFASAQNRERGDCTVRRPSATLGAVLRTMPFRGRPASAAPDPSPARCPPPAIAQSGTGLNCGLKIRRRKACGFESPSRHLGGYRGELCICSASGHLGPVADIRLVRATLYQLSHPAARSAPAPRGLRRAT